MRRLAALPIIAGLLTTGTAAADVQLRFIDPQRFTDAGLHHAGPVDAQAPSLRDLRRILDRAGRAMPPGQTLVIEVLDVDLAGHFPTGQSQAAPIRVMDPTTWPRISLRYALMQDGRRVAGGEDVLMDLTYLSRAGAIRSTAPLRFEEPMLIDWFDRRFSTPRR